MSNEATILRVSGQSRPNAVAGAIAALIRSGETVEIQAIGPTAVNQTIKAAAIARGYLQPEGLDLSLQPSFTKMTISGEEKTAVHFSVRREALAPTAPASSMWPSHPI